MQDKHLFRSRNARMVAGVAGGIAAYLNTDPLFIRLGFLALTMFNGIGALIYVILWFLVPNEDSAAADSRTQVRENVAEMQSTAEEMAQRVRGMLNR